MSYKTFNRDRDFYYFLEGLVPEFDINKSLPCSRFTFFTKDGQVYRCGNLVKMLMKLNELNGKETFCYQRSRAHGRYSYLIFLADDSQVSKPEEKAPELIVEAVEDDIKEDSPVFVPLIDKSAIDWDRLNTLQNIREDKDFLDNYAEINFGIKLRKNKKIENMLEDFVSGLESI